MPLAACVLELFTSRQNHRAQLDAAVRRPRHLPRRLGGAQERRAARSPACASAGAARRPDSAADRKVRRRIAVKPMLTQCTPVHASARCRPYSKAYEHARRFLHGVYCVKNCNAFADQLTPDLKRCSKNVAICENKECGEKSGVRGGSPAEKKWRF